MKKYKKGGFPVNGDLFICSSERENNIVGTFNNNGFPHQPKIIPESMASAMQTAIEKECETIWLNELIQQTSAYRP